MLSGEFADIGDYDDYFGCLGPSVRRGRKGEERREKERERREGGKRECAERGK